jgi:hypothetical protein
MSGFELSATELDVVWRACGLGPIPLIIDVPSVGATNSDRRALERRVWADLIERGLADDHACAHSRLADRLVTIAQRARSLQLRVIGTNTTNAILATRGRHHVLGVLRERFHLTAVPGTGIAKTLLALLPDVPAGHGHSVTVSTGTFATAVKNPATAIDVLRKHGLNTDDARTLLTMSTGCIRTIQVVAETRDAEGRCIRAQPISVHDTPTGRYRVIRTITDGGDHLTVTPASAAALESALTP